MVGSFPVELQATEISQGYHSRKPHSRIVKTRQKIPYFPLTKPKQSEIIKTLPSSFSASRLNPIG